MKNIHKMAPDGTSLLADAGDTTPNSSAAPTPIPPMEDSNSRGATAAGTTTTTMILSLSSEENSSSTVSSFNGAAAQAGEGANGNHPTVVKMEIGSPTHHQHHQPQQLPPGVKKLEPTVVGIQLPQQPNVSTDASSPPLRQMPGLGSGNGIGDDQQQQQQELVTMSMEDISRFAQPVNSEPY